MKSKHFLQLNVHNLLKEQNMNHHLIHHRKEFQKYPNHNSYKEELYKHLDIFLHNILYNYDRKIIAIRMVFSKVFYCIIQNIF